MAVAKVVALAGNPNTGKTSLFNALTGSRQRVGNWPGVTVERKEGALLLEGREISVVDLPGIYSVGASSLDEQIASDYLVGERPDLVLVVVDAASLERNLYLVVQLREMGLPMALALNRGDLARERGLSVDGAALERLLGVPVVPTVACSGRGVAELRRRLLSLLDGASPAPLEVSYGPVLEAALERLAAVADDMAASLRLSPRLAALRLAEGDPVAWAVLEGSKGRWLFRRVLANEADRVEKGLGCDIQTALIERRWAFVSALAESAIRREAAPDNALSLSDRIDNIVTHRLFGLPLFLVAAWGLFKVTFVLGDPVAEALRSLLAVAGEGGASLLESVGAGGWPSRFFADGIVAGLGAVVVFFPHIFLLFLLIAAMEDSGYMARGAFIMDRLMRGLGLHGKSFMPLLMGFGCNVPSIMATRILERPRDRMITLLVLPFMSCSARLPLFLLFAGTFFGDRAGTVVFSLYVLGMAVAILSATILSRTLFVGESSQFIMELPPYHLPEVRTVLSSAWERASLFLRKAGSFIFLAVLAVWLLASLPFGVAYASAESWIGRIGQALSGLLAPAGFGFWQATVALLFGFLAKEIVLGTLAVLFAAEPAELALLLPRYFSPLSAYAFMVMALLYVPCVAVVAAFKGETNSWRWTLFMVLYTTLVAWISAVAVYQGGRLLEIVLS